MHYNYGAILGYDPKWIIESVNFFEKEREDTLNTLKDIEEKQKLVQHSFDIFNPNITFSVGPYQFDKESYSVDLLGNFGIIGNSFSFRFLSGESTATLQNESVMHIENVQRSVSYMDIYFLSKERFTNNVTWIYDLSGEAFQGTTIDSLNPYDILPFSIASSIFYKKVEEHFEELLVKSHDITSTTGLISKEVAIREFNLRVSDTVECSPLRILGANIQIYNNEIFTENTIALYADTFTFKNSYIFTEKSPVNYEYMVSNFMLSNLSNITRLIISEKPMNERLGKEIITSNNFDELKVDILPKDTESIDDSFKVFRSGGNNALTFRTLHMILTEKLSQFYALQLKLFLTGYDGSGPLGELIKFIEAKIKELQSKYVFNDECKKTPLNNIDEGCDIECGRIALDEPHLMVTKQKLKALVRCSLSCEGVL